MFNALFAGTQRFIIAMLAIAGLSTTQAAFAQDRDEMIRAAMVFNFARYTEWTQNPPDEAVELCVSQDADIARELASLAGRDVNGRLLRVQDVAVAPGTCHIAYLSSADVENGTAARLSDQGVLTISSADAFSAVGVIELIRIGRQTRFSINNSLASDSGLKLSSRLLRLAVEVR